jgi:hypothetical protein
MLRCHCKDIAEKLADTFLRRATIPAPAQNPEQILRKTILLDPLLLSHVPQVVPTRLEGDLGGYVRKQP